MERVLIKNLSGFIGQEVEISGWVADFRSSGKIGFWLIRDGSGFLQAILDAKVLSAEKWEESQKVTLESSVKISATVAKHPKKEEFELQIKDFSFYQIAKEYPIAKKEHGTDFCWITGICG